MGPRLLAGARLAAYTLASEDILMKIIFMAVVLGASIPAAAEENGLEGAGGKARSYLAEMKLGDQSSLGRLYGEAASAIKAYGSMKGKKDEVKAGRDRVLSLLAGLNVAVSFGHPSETKRYNEFVMNSAAVTAVGKGWVLEHPMPLFDTKEDPKIFSYLILEDPRAVREAFGKISIARERVRWWCGSSQDDESLARHRNLAIEKMLEAKAAVEGVLASGRDFEVADRILASRYNELVLSAECGATGTDWANETFYLLVTAQVHWT
jgi:hypothetical protein